MSYLETKSGNQQAEIYRMVVKRIVGKIEEQGVEMSGYESSGVSGKITRETLPHKFPYPSAYSRMALGRDAEFGSIVVIKTYGQKTSEEGHSMEMNKAEASFIAGWTNRYIRQHEEMGINVAKGVVLTAPMRGTDDWGIRLVQDFIKGPNFMDVFIEAVLKSNCQVEERLLEVLLGKIHQVHNYKSKDRDLFPYAPKDDWDLVTGIDGKPQNIMLTDSQGTPQAVVVDVVYPTAKVDEEGTFVFIKARPGFVKKDPGWQYLKERLGDIRGLYAKTVLELGGGVAQGTDDLDLIKGVFGRLQQGTVSFLEANYNSGIAEPIISNIMGGCRDYLPMCGRGEQLRFERLLQAVDS